jgi:ribosomal protein S18 acetylase RimI-like enzyme
MAELSIDRYTVRGYRPGDAEALAATYNAMERAVGGHPGYVADETHAVIEGTVHDLDADTRLVFAPGGELAGAGIVATPPAGGYRVDLYGGVDPSFVGRGIGRAVLGWQIERAAEIHKAVAPDAEWTLEVAMNLADGRAIRLYERLGFTVARYFFEMLAPARIGIEAPIPAGLRVITYDPSYERALYDAHMEAFSDHWGYQRRDFEPWTGFTTRSELFRPELSRIAFDGDEIAGYVLAYDDADPDRAYVGQVGTRRPWRRRGLAGGLLADVLGAAARAGKGHVYLGVDADSPTGAVGVYERVGFEVEARAVAYRKPLS